MSTVKNDTALLRVCRSQPRAKPLSTCSYTAKKPAAAVTLDPRHTASWWSDRCFKTRTVMTGLPLHHMSCKVCEITMIGLYQANNMKIEKKNYWEKTEIDKQWGNTSKRDREIELGSSGSIFPHPFPCPLFLLELRVTGLPRCFRDRVAWRTSRCYGYHSSGWARESPSLQGPPRQRKSIEIRTWGRVHKAVPATQEKKNRKRTVSIK